MRHLLLLLALTPLATAGCAASWASFDVYAPHDARLLLDAEVSVVRPVVTTRPDTPDTPWGELASRLHRAAIEELDGPFVAAGEADADELGWSPDSWSLIDDVANALLSHVPNPLPRGEHRIQEGDGGAAIDRLGADGYVLLMSVQPSMKETLARLMGASGEVTRFSGFQRHLNQWQLHDAGARRPDPLEPELTGAPGPGEAVDVPQPEESPTPVGRRVEVGKQNRVDVALILVDRRSGRLVALHSARLEPVTGPRGSFRGVLRRALRDWRLQPEPWTVELFEP